MTKSRLELAGKASLKNDGDDESAARESFGCEGGAGVVPFATMPDWRRGRQER